MISQFFRLRTTAYLSKFIPQTQTPQTFFRMQDTAPICNSYDFLFM